MKLFLSSISITKKNQAAFMELVGKNGGIKVALIENGADTYAADHREWVNRARTMIEEVASYVKAFDLRKYDSANELELDLSGFDIVWVGGGNTYYLRWIMRESGFDRIIGRLCARGVVYGGDSAGAIVAGPTIDYFQSADSPEDSPSIILDGLKLTDIVVVPHADHKRYAPLMKDIKHELDINSFHAVSINDDEAVIINGKDIRKI